MKLTLKIKPDALFKLRVLIDDEMNLTVNRLMKYEEADPDALTEFDKLTRDSLRKDLTALEDLQGAYLTALDNMVTWIE